uniref:Uncharacterized protein n=1 Tax=Aegilops tauschii subsp. strangulata TaxID=200361 RepID=A0A453EQJ7_AEGTS
SRSSRSTKNGMTRKMATLRRAELFPHPYQSCSKLYLRSGTVWPLLSEPAILP